MRASSKTFAHAIANPTHIYIIGFSDGIVKVGRTGNPKGRLRTLSSQARRRGAVVTDQWFHETNDARVMEWWLRTWGYQWFERLEHKTEYFRAEFNTVLFVMETLFIRHGHLDRKYKRLSEWTEWPELVIHPEYELGGSERRTA